MTAVAAAMAARLRPPAAVDHRGHMDGSGEDSGYSGLFYFMLTIGIIGLIGFIVVCGSIQ